jgi:hypothetical protein
MTASTLLALIEEALDGDDSIADHDRVEGEDNVIGISTSDGGVFFIRVEEG